MSLFSWVGDRAQRRRAPIVIDALEPRRLLSVSILKGDILPRHLTVVGDTLFFSAATDAAGRELWSSKGTGKSTKLLVDLDPGPVPNDTFPPTGGPVPPRSVVNVGGTLFFGADDAAGPGLFRSDGTPAGTTRIISTGAEVQRIVNDGNILYFTDGSGVWRSNGTAKGTLQLLGGKHSPVAVSKIGLIAVGDHALYIPAISSDQTDAMMLASDGKSTITTLASSPIVAGQLFGAFASLDDVFYFQLPTKDGHAAIWTTNGKASGTRTIWVDLATDDDSGNPPIISELFNFNDKLYFTTSDASGQSLWLSHGTAKGTIELKHYTDLPSDISNQFALRRFGAIGKELYMTIDDADAIPAEQLHLYKTDGTVAGTKLVKDFPDESVGEVSGAILSAKSALYFVTSGYSDQLWRSDGTARGTQVIGTINENEGGFSQATTGAEVTLFNNQLYFVSFNDLWTAPLTVPARIRGVVFTDDNANGVLNSHEYGLQDRSLWLDLNDNGKFDKGEPETHTRSDGSFIFNDVAPGTYNLRVTTPDSYTTTRAQPFKVVATAQKVTHINIGQITPGRINGLIYDDTEDRLGQYYNQGGILGVRVFLDQNNNGVLNKGETFVRTDPVGVFDFGDLAPGIYHVRETPLGGDWTPSTGTEIDVPIKSGKTYTLHFGNVQPKISMRGVAFIDANQNGLFDYNESGLSGVTVFVDLNRDGQLDDGEPSAAITHGGRFDIELLPGTYAVRALPPKNYTSTTPQPLEIKLTHVKELQFPFVLSK